MRLNIAVDGPAGAGKSTIAKEVAKRLGITYIDTGAMYRAMAYYMYCNQVDVTDAKAIEEACQRVDITLQYEDGTQVVYLNGENVNGVIRTEMVGNMASTISTNLKVRERLVALQQKLAADADCIMDGRDIGTCVLPKANVKVYLTASSLERAKRRYLELTQKGMECNLEQIQADIEERDYRDMHREHSPLKQAEDAVLIDSSFLSVEEVINQIIELTK